MAQARARWLLLVVFVIALVIRILFLAAAPLPNLVGDARAYDSLALRLADGDGYVNSHGEATSNRPPGYPLFLAVIYWSIGPNVLAVGVVQAVLDALTCLMIYVIARRIFSINLSLVAAGFSIFSFGMVVATRLVLSESFATFLVVLAFLLLHTGLSRPSRLALCGSGIVLGFGALTKGTLILLPFLIGWVIYRASQGEIRIALERWAIVLICFSFTLFPWILRNYYVHHRFVPVATHMGRILYSSYNPYRGKIFGVYTKNETTKRIRAMYSEADQSKAFLDETFRFIYEHPDILPKVTLLKIIYLISPIDWELSPGAGNVNFTFAFAAPFAIYGLWLTRRGDWHICLLSTVLIGFFIMAILTYGSPRLRLPAEPFMGIFSGIGIMGTIRSYGRNVSTALIGISVYFIGLLFLFIFSEQFRYAARFVLRNIGLW